PLAPLVVQDLGDLVLAADFADAAVTAEPGQDDLCLLLRAELPLLAQLAQPNLPSLGATMIQASRLGQPSTRYQAPRQGVLIADTGEQFDVEGREPFAGDSARRSSVLRPEQQDDAAGAHGVLQLLAEQHPEPDLAIVELCPKALALQRLL